MSKILLIAPTSNGYFEKIIDHLQALGHDCLFIPDFVPSFFNRSLRFISKKGIKITQNKYIKNKVRNITDNFDHVLIIRGYAYDYGSISFIKSKFNAQMTLYQWDPLAISLFDQTAIPLFNRAYTFDFNDATKYRQLEQLSLFYIPKPNKTEHIISTKNNKYNFSFVGVMYPHRLEILEKVYNSINLSKHSFLFRLFCNKKKFYFYKYFTNKFDNLSSSLNWVKSKSLSWDTAQLIFENTDVVIDIHHPSQNGLSIRVLEVLSKGKKLMTTNDNIKKEVYYNSNMIFVFDNSCDSAVLKTKIEAFLLTPSTQIDIKKYELGNWLNYILKL